MPIPYRPLFLLDADTASICEIKRLDVQSDNPGDVYFWLYFDRASRQLSHLTFVSMHADGDEQEREQRPDVREVVGRVVVGHERDHHRRSQPSLLGEFDDRRSGGAVGSISQLGDAVVRRHWPAQVQ